MAEHGGVLAQPVLPEAHELREREAEGGVVAQRAQVAQVVGHPFPFQQQRAQPPRARRRHHAQQRLRGLRVGPREGDGGVARDAPGEAVALGDGERLEALVDALVHVAQALLEAQHLLADDGEAEVAGLDDAGVDGAHRDLVHAVALDAHEVVVGERVGRQPGGIEVAAQREGLRGPGAVAQPGARVGRARGADAQQVEERALHAAGGREEPRQVRVAGRGVLHQEFHHGEAVLHRVGGVDGILVLVLGEVAVVGAPQRHQAPAAFADEARGLRPLPLARGRDRRRHVAGEGLPLHVEPGDAHGR